MSVRVGRRLPGMLIAAMIVYAAAANSLVVWLYLVCAMLVAMVPIGMLGPVVASRHVVLRFGGARGRGFVPPLPQDRGRIFAGDRVTVRLSGDIDLDRCTLGPVRAGDGVVWEVGVRRLDTTTVLVEGEVVRRGAIRLDAIRCRCTWPLGLIVVDRWIPLAAELLAHPRYAVPALGRSRGDLNGEEETSRRGHGEDYVGVREYRSGDSRRHVHWLATARMGRLMVIETAAPAATPARFDLRLLPGSEPGTADRAVFVAASLIAACVASGRPFRLAGVLPHGSLRRWNEVLPHLAAATARVAHEGPGDRAVIVITADHSGVAVIPPQGDPQRIADNATDEDILHLLDGLR